MDADTARQMIAQRQADLLAAKRPTVTAIAPPVVAHPSPFPIGVKFGPARDAILPSATRVRSGNPDDYTIRGSDEADRQAYDDLNDPANHNARLLAQSNRQSDPEPAEEMRQILAPVAHLLALPAGEMTKRERATLAKRLKKAIRMQETAGVDLDSPLSFEDWYANRVDARSLVCSFV